MPGLIKFIGGDTTPFGKNNFLRSTQPGSYLTESRTIAAESFPAEMIDGTLQKILQPGEVLAAITSGDDAGKYGVFTLDPDVTDGRNVPENIVGVNKSFFPWQLLHRDVEVACCYTASVVQAWCSIRGEDGVTRLPVPNSIATALGDRKDLNITFK